MSDLNSSNEHLSQTFAGLNVSGEEVSSKEFDGCTFRECDFSEASFKRCKFIDCHFIKCNLSVTRINTCKFLDVTFDDCKLVGIDWTKAAWPNLMLSSPIKFNQCIMNDSSFFGLSLEEIEIRECKAHDVDFREANLSEANFTHTDFSNSLFHKSNLTGSDFSDAQNYDIDVYSNTIKRAKFCRYEAVSLLESLGIELVD